MHASPFEHQATPDGSTAYGWNHASEHGNFVGWRQLRKMMPGECVR